MKPTRFIVPVLALCGVAAAQTQRPDIYIWSAPSNGGWTPALSGHVSRMVKTVGTRQWPPANAAYLAAYNLDLQLQAGVTHPDLMHQRLTEELPGPCVFP
jgi:hypothetical protein